jgi:thymidylate synthase
MNIFGASLMLSLVARLTGYKPGVFTHFMADAHIYVNHVDQVRKQIQRQPHALPTLVINDRVPDFHHDGFHPEWIDMVEPSDFTLEGYSHDAAISMAMAV